MAVLIDPHLRDPHPALMLALLMLAASVVMAYLLRRHGADSKRYHPDLAWLRATLYFCFCLTAAHYSGALWAVVGSIPIDALHLRSPFWWLATLLGVGLVLVAYGVILPRGSFHDGRRRHPIISSCFGAVWGVCQGLWFLSIWAWLERVGLPAGSVPIAACMMIAAFGWLWHRFYWDIYVAPPHCYREWTGRQLLLVHAPSLIFCIAHLWFFGDLLVFIGLQALAQSVTARVMRFPSWADDYQAEVGAGRAAQAAEVQSVTARPAQA